MIPARVLLRVQIPPRRAREEGAGLKKFLLPALLSLLLLLPAARLARAFSGYYYVIPSSVPLRECAAPECDVLLTAYQGDKVEILERTSTGWSRVRLVDRTGIGWIPSSLLSYSRDFQAKPVPPYYVNISSLPLRDGPSPGSGVLTTLHLHDRVEMLGVSASGWAQVRDLQTSLVGWVPPRYISSEPPSYRPRSPRRRVRPRQAPPKEETAPSEEKTPEVAPPPPKAM